MQTEDKSLNTQCFPEDYALIEGQVNIDKGKSSHAISLPSFLSLSAFCFSLHWIIGCWLHSHIHYQVCVLKTNSGLSKWGSSKYYTNRSQLAECSTDTIWEPTVPGQIQEENRDAKLFFQNVPRIISFNSYRSFPNVSSNMRETLNSCWKVKLKITFSCMVCKGGLQTSKTLLKQNEVLKKTWRQPFAWLIFSRIHSFIFSEFYLPSLLHLHISYISFKLNLPNFNKKEIQFRPNWKKN